MRQKIVEEIVVPDGVQVEYKDNKVTCTKSGISLSREFILPGILVKAANGQIIISTEKGNKKELKFIKSTTAHIKNLFRGLDNKYVYELEACNVHFPMTLKVDGSNLVITNFLGEKVPRKAKVLSGVDIQVKGQKITVTSNDIEAAGETATNIEKATKVRNRDRRVFQDGIFIVSKPEAKK